MHIWSCCHGAGRHFLYVTVIPTFMGLHKQNCLLTLEDCNKFEQEKVTVAQQICSSGLLSFQNAYSPLPFHILIMLTFVSEIRERETENSF